MSCCPYTLDAQTEANKRFVAGMQKNFNLDPGFYAAGLYINCMVVDAALKANGGKSDDASAEDSKQPPLQSYIPPDVTADKALTVAYDLLRK